jgi:hypothetical protein
MLAIEGGNIFRPHSGKWQHQNPFLWSDLHAENCTLGLQSIDCYFQPLSVCGVHSKEAEIAINALDQSTVDHQLELFSFSPSSDVCSLARTMKKSMVWIYGAVMHYLLRPSRSIMQPVYERILQVFPFTTSNNGKNRDLPKSYYQYQKLVLLPQQYQDQDQDSKEENKNYSTLGVHVRGGSTISFFAQDARKQGLSIDGYIEYIDQIAKQLEIDHPEKPLRIVFFASDSPEQNIQSSEYLTKLYPRPWKYIVLPRLEIGKGDPHFNMMKQQHEKNETIDHRTLTIEYLSDIEILSMTDIYLGTWSFVFNVVQGLRTARGLVDAKASCIIDIREIKAFHPKGMIDQTRFPMFCGNQSEMQDLWKWRQFEGPNIL